MNIRLAILVALAFLISACATTERETVKPETRVLERLEYVVKLPPEELLTLPPEVKNIDVDAATQADVARWVIANNDRMKALENLIKGIAQFLKNEQVKLDDEARKKNEEVGTSGDASLTVKQPEK